MSRLFTLLLLLFALSLQATAQTTTLSYRLARLTQDESQQSSSVSILLTGNPGVISEAIPQLGGHLKNRSGSIFSAIVPVSALLTLANTPGVERIEEGKMQIRQLNDRMLINNKIDLVHQGVSPLPQGYNGEGVVMGIIDTGIDFTHPDFQDSTGQTRILWIWDHMLGNSTNTPQPYNYGQEFSAAAINSGNASAHIDQTAHGTHVAGIAAGNGQADSIFTGAAPKADIIAVSLDFNQADDTWLSSVADAVEYIFNKADSLNKPCVINISAGTYNGSHDGQDLQALYIDNLITSKNGRMVVASAGNAGNYPLHLQQLPAGDTTFTWFRKYSSPAGIYIEYWGDTTGINSMKFSIGADVPATFTDRAQSAFTTVALNNGMLSTDTLKSYSGNRLALIQRYAQIIGNKYSMIFFIVPDSTTYYFRGITTGTGKIDCWSFDMINSGLPTASIYPGISKYKLPDFDQTICSSFQCSPKVLTVGQYVNRNNYMDVNNNLVTFPTTEGAIAASSSMGPTRDGRTKPDITSTGEVTMSCLKLSSQAWFLANQPFKLAQGGKHIRDGGTSSSAPAVAGIIALYLQKNPTATWQDIRNRVMLCSVQDNFTGTNIPNNTWGYGKADALAVLTGCNALSVQEMAANSVSIYPNPATNTLNVDFAELQVESVKITNALGQELKSYPVNGNKVTLDISGLPHGLYILSTDGSQPITKRFVKE
jgi:subtilisin family serine protease